LRKYYPKRIILELFRFEKKEVILVHSNECPELNAEFENLE
jgi:hypothetical protein